MGFEDRSASKDDLRQMRYLLEESMEQGAFGFSGVIGLLYSVNL
jgi:N-acyl-D-aspartate/D-glutamate deacylase